MKKIIDYLFQQIKEILPLRLKITLRNYIKEQRYNANLKILQVRTTQKRFILMATPEHGNLGDHAIAEAEHAFLKDYFPEKQIIEVTGNCYRAMKDIIKPNIRLEDILIICGGGFLGSLWMNEEELVRDIILTFPKNRIIVFPQTVFFEKNNHGHVQFKKSKEVFSTHQKILFAVRDKSSIVTSKKILGKISQSSVIFVPDIVMYFSNQQNRKLSSQRREGLLACMRRDKEKVVKEEVFLIIKTIANDNGYTLNYTDTVLNQPIQSEKRKELLQEKLDEFSRAQLVITDRLHGMLFSAITGTPCIALDNSSGKVAGVYDWIKDLNYVKLAKNMNELSLFASTIHFNDTLQYSKAMLKPVFDQFAEKIKTFSEE